MVKYSNIFYKIWGHKCNYLSEFANLFLERESDAVVVTVRDGNKGGVWVVVSLSF